MAEGERNFNTLYVVGSSLGLLKIEQIQHYFNTLYVVGSIQYNLF